VVSVNVTGTVAGAKYNSVQVSSTEGGTGNTANASITVTADTTTSVTSSVNPAVFGQSVTFTVTVSPVSGTGTPTGTVTLLDNGLSVGQAALSGGVATVTLNQLVPAFKLVGDHYITTNYGGDANFSGSTGSLTGNPQVVNKANTATTVTTSLNPSTFGQSVTFSATVSAVAPGAGAPGGSVTFLDGGTNIGTGVLAGGPAVFTTSALAPGSHTITTSYEGDGNYNGSTGSLVGNPQLVKPNPTDAAAVVSSPAPGSTFTGHVGTFMWSAGTNATAYQLYIGARLGGGGYFKGSTTGTSLTVSKLPVDGTTVYVRLVTTFSDGTSQHRDYTYTAALAAAMSSPAPGTTLSGHSVTFNWTSGTSGASYQLYVGKSLGGGGYFKFSSTTATSATVNDLPTNGSTVYVRLITYFPDGTSQHYDYTYTAALFISATIISPSPDSTLSGRSATFTWGPGTNAISYQLYVGKALGGGGYFSFSSPTMSTSATVTDLPANGTTIYVRLTTYFPDGTAQHRDYTYVSGP
jgi:hypothetical protein